MEKNSKVAHSIHGIRPVHHEPFDLSKGLIRIPELFATTHDTRVALTVSSDHTLEVIDQHKQYVLTGLTERVLNACLLLGESQGIREAWFTSRDIGSIGVDSLAQSSALLKSVEVIRSIAAFGDVRQDIDGEMTGIIERSAHGSGKKAAYRIALDVGFTDIRFNP